MFAWWPTRVVVVARQVSTSWFDPCWLFWQNQRGGAPSVVEHAMVMPTGCVQLRSEVSMKCVWVHDEPRRNVVVALVVYVGCVVVAWRGDAERKDISVRSQGCPDA